MKYAVKHKRTGKYVKTWDDGQCSGMELTDNICDATLASPSNYDWTESYVSEGHMYLRAISGPSMSCSMFVDRFKHEVEAVGIIFKEER